MLRPGGRSGPSESRSRAALQKRSAFLRRERRKRRWGRGVTITALPSVPSGLDGGGEHSPPTTPQRKKSTDWSRYIRMGGRWEQERQVV